MRRFLIPEFVQTSQMDCGPASLASLLGGFGIRASYGRLREACQTDVDGTSIDALEATANRLGLEAEQVMVPADHLLVPEAAALPAIVVVRPFREQTHFVVVWRRHGPLVQVMDPAAGRRWMPVAQLQNILHVHSQRIPAEMFEAWVRSPDFQTVLARQLRDLGAGRAAWELIDSAGREPGWRGLAALDAAARLVASLAAARGIRRGRAARELVVALAERARGEPSVIPDAYWFVAPSAGASGGASAAPVDASGSAGPANHDGPAAQVTIRGAVLVRARGPKPVADSASLAPELRAALREPPPRPWLAAFRMLDGRDRLALIGTIAVVTLAASTGLIESVLWRGLIDLRRDLQVVEQRWIALGLVVLVATIGAVVDLRACGEWLRLGRALEVRFRVAFAGKLRRLHDRYFHSRPAPDMADRGHAIRHLRSLTRLLGLASRTWAGLVLTAAAIAWFDPSIAVAAACAASVASVLPLLFTPWLAELDLRMRVHSGALSQFYFDALQGLTAIRAHGAEDVLRREQESLLVEWLLAARRNLRASLLLEGLQLGTGFALAAWLLLRHVQTLADTGGALLLAYWALQIPEYGGTLALLARQYPWQRNTLLRVLEPLGAPEPEAHDAVGAAPARAISSNDAPPRGTTRKDAGVTTSADPLAKPREVAPPGILLRWEQVTVVAGGHALLQDICCEVPAGSHVAIVGPSGAGKSSLLGVLLGWHRPATGQVTADGRPLDAPGLTRLRAATAWIDPTVQLWNQSLVDNLRFGCERPDAERLGAACRQADVIDVLEQLPEGMQTRLGEGGGLLSGGQGQRVRLARGLMRDDVRLVLLDEPFRGLDRSRRRELCDRVRRRHAAATLLLVSHDVADTLEFDRVLVIADGRIVEDGVPAQLVREDSRYRRLVEAEEAVRREIWEASTWCRWRMEEGSLTERTS